MTLQKQITEYFCCCYALSLVFRYGIEEVVALIQITDQISETRQEDSLLFCFSYIVVIICLDERKIKILGV